MIVDATECETERPKKQKESYSGKQICVAESKGAVHDLELFRQSGVHILNDNLLIGDKGYQGLTTLHNFSFTPFKKSKNGELTQIWKEFNNNLSKYRIRIEHVNRRIKRFKILQIRYRNEQKKHLLRVSALSGIYSYEFKF
ncbi:hypothetical protein FACS1894188_07500 [Clostridia bacterium]|nr:hypothetical protein FACS1894188_07500 [Clostridia bacterium]